RPLGGGSGPVADGPRGAEQREGGGGRHAGPEAASDRDSRPGGAHDAPWCCESEQGGGAAPERTNLRLECPADQAPEEVVRDLRVLATGQLSVEPGVEFLVRNM